MTRSDVESWPADWLLAWLSARGGASRPTIDRACQAIAERFDQRVLSGGPPTYRYVQSLRRIGHVEFVRGGLVVVPTTLCWSRRAGRGMLVGARDEFLLGKLRLDCSFVASHPGPLWPATWTVAGERARIEVSVAALGISVVDEPGMRLLASLPTLEEAIRALPESDQPSSSFSWELAVDGQWYPVAGNLFVVKGLVRRTDRQPRVWMIERAGAWRRLDTPEERAVAWWAELARLGRHRLVYAVGRLVLPASPLPPPVMVERPLIWASAEPPGRDSKKRCTYEAVEPERAVEVARILGLPREDE
jgi:hypothetical protein